MALPFDIAPDVKSGGSVGLFCRGSPGPAQPRGKQSYTGVPQEIDTTAQDMANRLVGPSLHPNREIRMVTHAKQIF